MTTLRNETVLSRQWNNYRNVHRHRANLMIHVLTVPVFMAGTVSVAVGLLSPLLVAPWTPWVAAGAISGGLFAMTFAIALQGRGHKKEANPPEPFRGPRDVIARLFLEQWVSFPRYVLSGAFRRAFAKS